MINDSEWNAVMEIWHEIKDEDTRADLGIIWLEKDKLEYVEVHEKNVVEEAVRLLKLIRDKPDREKLKHHQRDFLRLLHHVQPTREWQTHIQEELDEIGAEIKQAEELLKRKVAEIAQRRMEARKQIISQAPKSRIVQETKTVLAQPIDTKIDLTDHKGAAFGFIEGRFEFNGQITFKLKKINLKGQTARMALREITSQIGFEDEIDYSLSECTRNDDPLNINFTLDFGDLWPMAPIPWGHYIDHETRKFDVPPPPLEFGISLLPKIRLSIKNIRIDLNSRPLTIFVEAVSEELFMSEMYAKSSAHLQVVNATCEVLKRMMPNFSTEIDKVREECFASPTASLRNAKILAELIGDLYEAAVPEEPKIFFSESLLQNLNKLGVEIDFRNIVGQIGGQIGYSSESLQNIGGKPYEQIVRKRLHSVPKERSYVIYIIRPRIMIKDMGALNGKVLLS